jgi:branched-subunit amino acid ABC-type transport system permease component
MVAEEKAVGRLGRRFVRSMRWILWALLLAAVVSTLEGPALLREAAKAGHIPSGLAAVPVALLAAFIVGYAIYRFTLVRAGRYPAGKAMMQIALMSLFLALMARWTADPAALGQTARPVDLSRALGSSEADFRALAAEVLRARPHDEAMLHAARLVALLADPSAEVRRQAHASLVAIVGQDLGAGADAAERWNAALTRPR